MKTHPLDRTVQDINVVLYFGTIAVQIRYRKNWMDFPHQVASVTTASQREHCASSQLESTIC